MVTFYRYSPEWQVVFEDRPGVHCVYTLRGTIAYVSQTHDGTEALALGLEAPPVPSGTSPPRRADWRERCLPSRTRRSICAASPRERRWTG